MKKVLSVLLLTVMMIFIGCGSYSDKLQKTQKDQIKDLQGNNGKITEVTEGQIFDTIKDCYQDSKAYTIDNLGAGTKSLLVIVNIPKQDKKVQMDIFVDVSAKISANTESYVVKDTYTNMVVMIDEEWKYTGNSITFRVQNNKLEHQTTFIDKYYTDSFNKSKEEAKIK